MQVHRDLSKLPTFRNPVLTIGSFDGVHLGHQSLLQRIRQQATQIAGESILVTFDPHPRHVIQLNQPPLRLLTTTAEKIQKIAAQGIDHLVIVNFNLTFSQQSAREYLHDFLFGKFNPHTVVIGYDHRFGAGREGDIELLRKEAAAKNITVNEISVHDIDKLAVSSTRIRRALESGDVESAATLLGGPFSLTGRVVHGEAIGRTIGFPTANLDLEAPYKLLPADGVYAVQAVELRDESEVLSGMLYIGERPSLEGKRPRSIEVNLLNFDADLYGSMLRVDIVAHVRDDQAFSSLDSLKAQIERDRDSTRELLKRHQT